MAQSRSDFIFEELLNRIKNQTYKDAEKLPTEQSFCAEFKVSRPIVRAALARLREEGLIRSIRGSGSFVSHDMDEEVLKFSPIANLEETIKCMEYRIILEGKVAASAAKTRTDEEMTELMRALEVSKQHETGSLQEDIAFHMVIAKISHNRFYLQAMQVLSAQMINSFYQVANHFKDKNGKELRRLKDFWHTEITRAILIKDPVLAKAMMEAHLLRAKSNLEEALRMSH